MLYAVEAIHGVPTLVERQVEGGIYVRAMPLGPHYSWQPGPHGSREFEDWAIRTLDAYEGSAEYKADLLNRITADLADFIAPPPEPEPEDDPDA